MKSTVCGRISMSEENEKEIYAEEIEDLQKRLDSHQTLLEILSLVVLFLLVYIFMAGSGLFAIVIEIVIILIMIFRFLIRLEKGKI
jgi:archaellum biogenesis protein FlaJ (TadC family)